MSDENILRAFQLLLQMGCTLDDVREFLQSHDLPPLLRIDMCAKMYAPTNNAFTVDSSSASVREICRKIALEAFRELVPNHGKELV